MMYITINILCKTVFTKVYYIIKPKHCELLK